MVKKFLLWKLERNRWTATSWKSLIGPFHKLQIRISLSDDLSIIAMSTKLCSAISQHIMG